jgi:hypothetical protein
VPVRLKLALGLQQSRRVRFMLLYVCLVLGVAACTPGREFARPTTPNAETARPAMPPFYLHGDVGLGAPEGLIGGGLGVSPTSWSSTEVGLGLSDSGFQAAAMLGLRLRISEPATLGISSGLSIGRYTVSSDPFFDDQWEKVWPWVLWSNTEVTIRHELDARTALRFHAGVAISLAAANPTCSNNCGYANVQDLYPYLGFGFERHF